MPARLVPLITHQVYHIFNKTQGNEEIFAKSSFSKLMLDAIRYYQFIKTPMKLSHFRHTSIDTRQQLESLLNPEERFVSVLSYCLMPNHFHLLLRQNSDRGISTFMSKVQNSLTRFTNIKRKTKGHVFIGQFRAVRIESDEQLLHVSRYIHLNPYTGYVVKSISDAINYPWSSFKEYSQKRVAICDQSLILSHFKTHIGYLKFIEDQKDYQRTLADIKHSVFE